MSTTSSLSALQRALLRRLQQGPVLFDELDTNTADWRELVHCRLVRRTALHLHLTGAGLLAIGSSQ